MPVYNSSLGIINRLKTKYKFYMAAMLSFYILY